MRETIKPAVLLLTAAVLAALADALFRGAAWGINVGLWGLAVGVVVVALSRRAPLRLRRSAPIFGGLALVFALLFALRDSNTLRVANGIAMALCLGAALMPSTARAVRDSTVGELIASVLTGLGLVGSEAFALGATVKDVRLGSSESRGRTRAVGRGLVLAVPLLFLFGGLFASADPVFRQKAESLFRFDLDLGAFTMHVWTFALGLVVAGGLLHRAFRWAGPKPPVVGAAPPSVQFSVSNGSKGVGITEIGIVLGSLVLLFASFLAVQFRYLFGAAETVRATAGLSYAEYARGGFFELVWVAGLALVVVLGAGASLRRERERDDVVFRWFGRVLVAMVFLVVGSAMIRMKLYTDAYGLSELRIYSSVFMGWITLALGWMLLSTLAARPRRFAFGAFAAGLLTIFTTNLLNPDRLIVRTNLSRPRADFAYLKTLGDDAALALERMRASIPAAHRAEAEALISARRQALRYADWREGNLARWSLAR